MSAPTMERPAVAPAPVEPGPEGDPVPRRTSRRRSLLKAASWRLLGTVGTMTGAWFVTGEWSVTIAIGSVEAASKFALFYLHERIWERLG